MKVMKNAVLMAGCLLAGSVALAAEPVSITIPTEASLRGPGISHAEIVADLQVWRLSGMESIAHSDSGGWTVAEYDIAMARYKAIRNSQEFQMLVRRLEEDPKAIAVAR